jgi:hypothetical protein
MRPWFMIAIAGGLPGFGMRITGQVPVPGSRC